MAKTAESEMPEQKKSEQERKRQEKIKEKQISEKIEDKEKLEGHLNKENTGKKEPTESRRIAELTEMLQRLQAEFENFQKRINREKEEHAKFANKDLLLKLIPIADNFELALKQNHKGEEFHKGVELIFSQLMETLKSEGLKPIEENGTFNPEIHEALMQEESNRKKGEIIEVFQKGYTLHGKMIRTAKVKVSK